MILLQIRKTQKHIFNRQSKTNKPPKRCLLDFFQNGSVASQYNCNHKNFSLLASRLFWYFYQYHGCELHTFWDNPIQRHDHHNRDTKFQSQEVHLVVLENNIIFVIIKFMLWFIILNYIQHFEKKKRKEKNQLNITNPLFSFVLFIYKGFNRYPMNFDHLMPSPFMLRNYV